MHPTREVDTCQPSRCNGTTSLSLRVAQGRLLPQRGYCPLNLSILPTQLRDPTGLTKVLWPVRALLQACQPMGIKAALPAIEGLGTEVRVAAGESSVPATLLVVVHPLEALANRGASSDLAALDSSGIRARLLDPGTRLPYALIGQPLYQLFISRLVSPIYLNEHSEPTIGSTPDDYRGPPRASVGSSLCLFPPP